MIFPVLLSGWWGPSRAPLTYLLLALNLLVFSATYETYDTLDTKLDEILADQTFIVTQGSAFAVMIRREGSTLFSPVLRELADNSLRGDLEARKILGNLALRNNEFMDRAESYDFGGNVVALEAWRTRFAEMAEVQAEHPSYVWGISRLQSGWMQYITYQFSHSGFQHLFWNMVFLVIFGTFVEVELGSSFVVLTYVGSGVLGALAFSRLSGISSSPLVGASAAVSGLMALVGFYWIRRSGVRFLYWVLPIRGYFGFAMLPSWLILVVLLIPDLSGTISASPEISSVAYGAHIGGSLFGAAIAGLLWLGWMQVEVVPAVAGQRMS